MRVFIAGATGVIGRRMIRQFLEKNHRVVGLARDEKGKQTIQRLGGEAVFGDMFDADSMAAAVKQADVVIHAATAIPAKVSSNRADWAMNDRLRREGTRALTAAAAGMGANHFHSFVDTLLSKAARVPFVMPFPTKFRFQSVDVSEVAARLAGCLADGPRRRLVDFGGPEVLTVREMAKTWMEVSGIHKKLFHLPLPGAVAKALRAGKNTSPEGVRGTIRWREWLERRADSQTVSFSRSAHAIRF